MDDSVTAPYYSPLVFPGVGTFLAFSGNGAYRNRGACGRIAGHGPIPSGKYWIVDRPQGGVKSKLYAEALDIYNQLVHGAQFNHTDWFALWRDDGAIDDFTWIEGVKRSHFRLHPGTLSAGCITVVHNSDFARLRSALLITPLITIPNKNSVKAYGAIEVISYGKKCV